MATPPVPSPASWRKGADLGNAARAARLRLKLTPAEVGRRAGVSRKFVYDLESGKETLRADKVLAVLAALRLQAVLLPR